MKQLYFGTGISVPNVSDKNINIDQYPKKTILKKGFGNIIRNNKLIAPVPFSENKETKKLLQVVPNEVNKLDDKVQSLNKGWKKLVEERDSFWQQMKKDDKKAFESVTTIVKKKRKKDLSPKKSLKRPKFNFVFS